MVIRLTGRNGFMTVIQIVGPSSAGKTTVINHLKSESKLLSRALNRPVLFSDDYARIIFDNNYKDTYSTFDDLISDPYRHFAYQVNIGEQTLRAATKYLDDDTLFICDGGALGNTVYLKIAYKQLPTKRKRNNLAKNYKRLLDKLYDFSEQTNLIYLDPPVNSSIVEDDGFRPATLINSRSRELDLFSELKYFAGIKTYSTPTLLSERLDRVDDILLDFNLDHKESRD